MKAKLATPDLVRAGRWPGQRVLTGITSGHKLSVRTCVPIAADRTSWPKKPRRSGNAVQLALNGIFVFL
jgi:hypothetical protein